LSTQNIIADAESRIAEPDIEWSLSEEVFHKVLEIFGPFNVDLFASLNTINVSLTYHGFLTRAQ